MRYIKSNNMKTETQISIVSKNNPNSSYKTFSNVAKSLYAGYMIGSNIMEDGIGDDSLPYRIITSLEGTLLAYSLLTSTLYFIVKVN